MSKFSFNYQGNSAVNEVPEKAMKERGGVEGWREGGMNGATTWARVVGQ